MPSNRSTTETPRAVGGSSGRRRLPLLALVALLAVGIVAVSSGRDHVVAAPQTSGGWTTNTSTSPTSVGRGQIITVNVTVTSSTTRRALVDLELYSPARRVFQKVWADEQFTAGKARTLVLKWTIPSAATTGAYTTKVGMFAVGWAGLQHWNDSAGQFSVTTGPPTTTTTTTPPTTSPSTTTTTPPTTTTTPPTTTTAPPTGRFTTLPVGAALPSDATCAARVRRTGTEIRPVNNSFNQTTGHATSAEAGPLFTRVTGSFTGTTDEILQWGACKWGLDEDIVRAQTAKESWWTQTGAGDYTTDPTRCVPGHPIGADGVAGQCPESIGILQVRYPYHGSAFPGAVRSTSYNVDYTFAGWRTCYEGQNTWLNQFERGRDYVAGDVWGCVGLWFAGRWYTPPATEYIAAVQSYLAQRIWETPEFRG